MRIKNAIGYAFVAAGAVIAAWPSSLLVTILGVALAFVGSAIGFSGFKESE